ncbi:MAG: hypothetical protein U0575_02950 [Phycisphaerales bacterium]|jgi:hypothetical protein
MTVPPASTRLSVRRTTITLGAIAVAFIAATHQAGAVQVRHPVPHWVVTDYLGLPPPPISPAILQQFWHLYTAFQASKADSSMPFSQWLIVNGINDPHLFAAMMLLYQWYAQNHEVA